MTDASRLTPDDTVRVIESADRSLFRLRDRLEVWSDYQAALHAIRPGLTIVSVQLDELDGRIRQATFVVRGFDQETTQQAEALLGAAWLRMTGAWVAP